MINNLQALLAKEGIMTSITVTGVSNGLKQAIKEQAEVHVDACALNDALSS